MSRMLPRAVFFLTLAAAAPLSTIEASQITISDMQPNIDFACAGCTGKTELPFVLFDFTKQTPLSHITGFDISFSAQVGSPDAHLRLGLDGIDTKIPLTGFKTDSLVQQTFSLHEGSPNWLSSTNADALLKDLKSGQIFASLLGDTPHDLKVQLYSDTKVTLNLEGTAAPEPASILIWLAGVGAIGLVHRRRGAA